MKVVIRNVKTGLYWSGFGWAVGINSDRDFIRGADAIAGMEGAMRLPCAEHSLDPSSTQYFGVANLWWMSFG